MSFNNTNNTNNNALQPTDFVKVASLVPDQHHCNLRLRVLSVEMISESVHPQTGKVTQTAEAIVGDETACILLNLKNDQVNLLSRNARLQVLNARVDMYRGFMRLKVNEDDKDEDDEGQEDDGLDQEHDDHDMESSMSAASPSSASTSSSASSTYSSRSASRRRRAQASVTALVDDDEDCDGSDMYQLGPDGEKTWSSSSSSSSSTSSSPPRFLNDVNLRYGLAGNNSTSMSTSSSSSNVWAPHPFELSLPSSSTTSLNGFVPSNINNNNNMLLDSPISSNFSGSNTLSSLPPAALSSSSSLSEATESIMSSPTNGQQQPQQQQGLQNRNHLEVEMRLGTGGSVPLMEYYRTIEFAYISTVEPVGR